MLSGKQIPNAQGRLTRFALTHPIRLALASGALVALWTAAIVGNVWAVTIAGVGTTLLVWYLWSPRGPARRREDRLYDESGLSRRD